MNSVSITRLFMADIDAIITELDEDGTLGELSAKYLGGDPTKVKYIEP